MTDKMLDEVMIALDAANGKREWPQFCTPIQDNIRRIAKRAEAAERKLEQARQAILTGHDLAAVADALGVKIEAQS